ncbi:hypothetical protein [Leucobacter luti]|uniref:Uncharacterized protein n=1 Tax=Leucobacter luti TaxID=340320 RepID=A0A4Q7TTH7_9MICO|nr:hypothetical protein [Leucobacter luti]MBL3699839.1 hypothetical protein [Leucobacter luti]RZT62842.1 hypothetical protein EV139_2548 [Leucobacter luti]
MSAAIAGPRHTAAPAQLGGSLEGDFVLLASSLEETRELLIEAKLDPIGSTVRARIDSLAHACEGLTRRIRAAATSSEPLPQAQLLLLMLEIDEVCRATSRLCA